MNHLNGVQQDHYWKRFIKDDMEVDFSEISKYVKDELDRNLSFTKEKDPKESREEIERNNMPLKYSTFQIIGCTIVQIPLHPKIDLKQIQVLIETNELIITIQSEAIQQVIPLQIKASANNCKAYLHNYVLEVRIPHDLNKNYINVPITPL